MSAMQLAFVLASTLGAAWFLIPLLSESQPSPSSADQSIRVLLSYRLGAGSFDAQYMFPNLQLVILGGNVQVSTGPNRQVLRPVASVSSDQPVGFNLQDGSLVATFEGINHTLEEVVHLKPADPAMPVQFRLLSTTRQNLAPEYPGELWLEVRGSGLLVVNQVDFQDYLKRVLPSEMPPTFHPEALKAQAVAARTYAYSRRASSSFWKQFGADLDDSISEQVYNNNRTHPATTRAVEATYNQILRFEGRPIQAFYFSTSPGATASIEEVWMDRPARPYLVGRAQTNPFSVSIENEAQALEFFQNHSPEGFLDASSSLWRWSVSLSREELEAILSRTLPERARASPRFVLTPLGPLSPDAPGFTLGTLQNLRVLRRTAGGFVTDLEIQTSTGLFVVRRESNIRNLLRPSRAFTGGNDVLLQPWRGQPRANFSVMPSSAFAMQKERDANGHLLRVTFFGGGFGHGVGMSQFGANGLGRLGYSYVEILQHFFPGAEISPMTE